MSAIRFGLVGCGRIGATADQAVQKWAVADHWLPYSHAAAIVAARGSALAAVCDVDPAAVATAQHDYDVPAGYVDYAEMFKTEQLDAVAIATRTSQRPGIIHAALNSGVKAIYCEKPLSNTLEIADDIARAANDAGAVFLYGTKRRFMPSFEGVRRRIDDGEIGEVVSIAIRLGFGSLFWTYPHAVDLALFFAQDARVISVQADLDFDEASVRGLEIDADPRIRSALIKFDNGVVAAILPGGGMDTEIVGRDGVVRIEGDGNAIRWRRRRNDSSDLGWLLDESVDCRAEASSGTQRSIEAIVDAISNGRNPRYTVDEAVRNHEVLFGMVESHLGGGYPVTVPLARRGLVITGRTGTLYA